MDSQWAQPALRRSAWNVLRIARRGPQPDSSWTTQPDSLALGTQDLWQVEQNRSPSIHCRDYVVPTPHELQSIWHALHQLCQEILRSSFAGAHSWCGRHTV